VFFEHAPVPTPGSSAARCGKIPGLPEDQIPLLTAKKFEAVVFCESPSRKLSLIQVSAD
jgi:hypothetical protein